MNTPTNNTVSIQDIARQQINTTKNVYLLSPQRMFSEFNGEKENVNNYNKRQLLEMLQNADDAASEAIQEKKVLIKLDGNKLVIANTGYPFSVEGLNSIFLSHLSPKEAIETQIGKKGLGFRSILSWSKKVTIKSNDLCVAFSEDYSKLILDELLQNENFKREFDILNKGNHIAPISTLVCPDVETAKIDDFERMTEYDTIIQLDLYEKSVKDVKKQIREELDAEVLLFLNNLEKIEIDINGDLSSFYKEVISPTTIKLNKYSTTEIVNKIWNINKISGRFTEIDKPYQLSIAWQDNLEEYKNVIYAYFRTKVPISIKGILHGSFELNADRNLIIDDGEDYNKYLIALLPELIAQTAEIIASKDGENATYKAINFLQVNLESLNHLLPANQLELELNNAIKTKYIFPSINNKYLSWNNDQPVYLEERVLTENLSPTKFNKLLQYCSEEKTTILIKHLTPKYDYKLEDIIQDISQNVPNIPPDVYASLIYVIHKYLPITFEANIQSLFFDNDNKILSSEYPIFFPNKNINYNLPSILGVQIINSNLAEALLEITQSDSYLGLSLKLLKYKIKEYKFTEIFEILIKHYTLSSAKIDDNIELHKHLFHLFATETIQGNKWSGTPVSLINKKGELALANELYFGVEYDNIFIDEIFHYDKGKILASPKIMNATEINNAEWKRYLEWLGVASFPRKIFIESIPEEYFLYCMKRFNYRNLIEGYKFTNYTDFISNQIQFGNIKIQDIDSVENILNNNSQETIIKWIHEDNDLLKIISEDREPAASTIGIIKGFDLNFRNIYGANISSYIKWRFLTSPWIETESGVKQAPAYCTSASNVTSEFSPLIEKPSIDFERLLKIGITRERLEYFLAVVGVHKSINTFTTKTLYSILLKLPEIDIEGKKAKTIYNQLSTNYDEKQIDLLDKTDINYINFHKIGKVFCKNGSYVPIKEAFYVNDKRYGEAIINQFNTIEIARRLGKEKITKLFGVKPLDTIELNIEGEPIQHEVSTIFEAEMELFKPYVYVLRKAMDSGGERNVIKETKFKLVTQLKLNLIRETSKESITLNEYEYYYFKKRNIVYIKAPNQLVNFTELKVDIQFCSAIAEVFSAILDVDSHRQLILFLFSQTSNARDELLRTELEDTNLQNLNDARQLLGITIDPKLTFWKAFTKCFNNKKIHFSSSSDSTLLQTLKTNFPIYEDIINEVFNNINYQDINEETSSQFVVKLLKYSGIYIKEFNRFHYPLIDIKELYGIYFKRALDELNEKFKLLYYEKCVVNEELKKKFIDNINSFNYLQPNIVNETDFDVYLDLKDQLIAKFNVDISLAASLINIDTIYQSNLTSLWQNSKHFVTEKSLFDQFIREDDLIQSLLYFQDQIGFIEARLRLWLGKNQDGTNQIGIVTKPKKIGFGDQTIFYEDLSDLRTQVDSIFEIEGLSNITSNTIKTSATATNLIGSTKPGSGAKGKGKPKIPKEDVGFLGEYLVYCYLKANIDNQESVKWVSKYAKECMINMSGIDGLGYDIMYIPNGATHTRYVEVKVVGWEDAFHISSNEVKCGEMYKKNYEIFLVRNLDTPTSAKIEKIQGLFDYKGKSFGNNDLFSVINDSFIIKFKKH